MKTNQLVEIENVKGANRVLKNLLEHTRTENVGLGLFYGRPSLGKTRWCSNTVQENGYIYLRLEANLTTKDFLTHLLTKLIHKTMLDYMIVGTRNEIYYQILDILQRNQDIVIIVNEIECGFGNSKILATIRDLIDRSLASFILVGMEQAKKLMLKKSTHYFDRCNAFFEFKPLSLDDTEKILKELCEVRLDDEIIKFIHSKCNGTMRMLNKFIDAIERIAKRLKKEELVFDEIKDIIVRVEA